MSLKEYIHIVCGVDGLYANSSVTSEMFDESTNTFFVLKMGGPSHTSKSSRN